MQTFQLVSIPIDHFPIVLYDKDFHCMGGKKFHITNKTEVIGATCSKWPAGYTLEVDTYEGFIVLTAAFSMSVEPTTFILTVTNEEIPGFVGAYVTDW